MRVFDRWRVALGGILLLALGGCVDVRSYEGSWSGDIVTSEGVRVGFSRDTEVEELYLEEVTLRSMTGSLTTSDGTFFAAPLKTVSGFANDALASLTFDGAPLRSYILYAPVGGGEAAPPASAAGILATVVVSLFTDDHLELRVLRGNELFGVFPLQRKE